MTEQQRAANETWRKLEQRIQIDLAAHEVSFRAELAKFNFSPEQINSIVAEWRKKKTNTKP